MICDDSELWIEPPSSIHLLSDIGKHMKTVLAAVGPAQQLLILTSSVNMDISSVIQIESMLEPTQYGTDPLLVAKGLCNSIDWMKDRYKDKKYQRELFFVMSNTNLINLAQ